MTRLLDWSGETREFWRRNPGFFVAAMAVFAILKNSGRIPQLVIDGRRYHSYHTPIANDTRRTQGNTDANGETGNDQLQRNL